MQNLPACVRIFSDMQNCTKKLKYKKVINVKCDNVCKLIFSVMREHNYFMT